MKSNYSLLQHNTFGIDAKAKYYAEYRSESELRDILSQYHAEVPPVDSLQRILHIGGGSNLLFLNDYEGLVLHSNIQGIEILEESDSEVLIRVGSGMVWDYLVATSLEHGWYGLENLSLIPGEVGASAVQNIGAYGAEAKDFIVRVHLVDIYTLEKVEMTNAEMHYAYRYSILKGDEMRGRYAVTYVDFRLSRQFTPHLEYGGLRNAVEQNGFANQLDAAKLRQIIIDMRRQKLPDPKVLGNGGSFFMNPVVDRGVFEKLLQQNPNMPHYEVDAQHVKIPAGWLIEQAGWKGKSLGKAGVYERQALVLVNLGGAEGQDIVNLCEAVRHDVQQKFGILIHPEVNFIGL